MACLIEVTLGPKSLKRIQDRVSSYEQHFASSAGEAKEQQEALRAKGREVFESLRQDNFTQEQVVQTAAAWWTNVLSAGSGHIALAPGENPIVLGLKSMARQSGVQGNITAFQTELEGIIRSQLAEGETVTLRTDYHPEDHLRDLALKHDINEQSFPEKTNMTIYPGRSNRLAVSIQQWEPNRRILPLTNESFSDSQDDNKRVAQYESILLGRKS